MKVLADGVDELKGNLEFKDMKFGNKTMKFYSAAQKQSGGHQESQSLAVLPPATSMSTEDLKDIVDKEMQS